jgi:glycosyltransferase involved in cell wall biosynthesis
VTTGPAAVSVVMPTLGLAERAPGLFRAIDSVVSQEGVRAVPLVVVNGSRADGEVRATLLRRRDLRVISLAEADLPRALRAGRAAVSTPDFAVLDDDDELLPGALATRRRALDEAGGADAVVTSGYLEGHGGRRVSIETFAGIEADPLRALLRHNWLRPCAGLFRTDAVPLEFFERLPAYREWTYLGVRLSLRCRIRFVSRPTFVYRIDTPGSLSKSKAYCLAGASAMARILELDLPRDVRAMVREHLTANLHGASEWERGEGNYGAAWRWHLRCLAWASGWRYLPYTGHLVAGPARRLAGMAPSRRTG